MKRSICILMCMCMLAAALPALAAGVTDVMCVYNCNEWVSLRESPDTSSKRLAKVRLGELVTDCKGSYDGFIQCEYDGKVGYIATKYLKMTDFSSGESFPGNQMVVNVSEWASMWSGPSTSTSRVVKVPVGSIVTSCVGTTGNFIYCEYTSGKKVYKGYISSSYLKKANYNVAKENTNITTVTAGGIDDITMTVVNCTDWVSLREKASASSARLAKVPLGTEVEHCKEVSNGFVYCYYRGMYGYIQGQYLASKEADEPEPDAPDPWDVGGTPAQDFSALDALPEYSAFLNTGNTEVCETYQGYTIVVQHINSIYEEMMAVCYDLSQRPLWRVSTKSTSELSDVIQLNAFVAGTIEDPQLIMYVNGLGLYSYSFGPQQKLRWFLSAAELDITDSIFHYEDYDGTFYIAFNNVLMHISADGYLMWRTAADDTSIFWPCGIEIDETGISVLYDNNFGLTNTYNVARFSLDGDYQYSTEREIPNEA